MFLTEEQIRRSNLFHGFLKKQPSSYFEETSISKCTKCEGIGLTHCGKMKDGSTHWDAASFCEECNGIGYKGIAGTMSIDLLNFVCKRCDGIGCKKCNNSGIVDWVTNIMG